MTAKRSWKLALAAVLAAGAAAAGDMPRLPASLHLPQSEDSPGVVSFDHDSHLDADQPRCMSCHPRLFSILGRSAARRERAIKHAAMEKGEACGACHGKQAFGFDDCTMCHAT